MDELNNLRAGALQLYPTKLCPASGLPRCPSSLLQGHLLFRRPATCTTTTDSNPVVLHV